MAATVLTTDNFEEEVLKSEVPVLVDFWATWCGPCQALSPIVEEVAGEVEGVKVGKVDVDDQDKLARKYKIFSIPTLLVFKNGEVAQRSVGAVPKEKILEMLK
ncbi:MAG: thioredoxin [Clostridium sp.]|nr:thioredoxin [Clostridium sp.]HAE81357.1 thioredoxin [Lachnoclostridium sp.]